MLLITDTDLDGVGCAVLFSIINPANKVYFHEHGTSEQKIVDIVDQWPWEYVFITDLSISQELATYLNRRGNVNLFDHHKTSLELSKTYDWAFVNTNYCATYIFYHFLSTVCDLRTYQEFVRLVNDHDLWLHQDPRSRQLARLLDLFGRKYFIFRIVSAPNRFFLPFETVILESTDEKIREYLESVKVIILTDEEGYMYVLAIAEKYTSELGEYLLNKYQECSYVVILKLDINSVSVSLRSRGDFDVSEIARRYGGGGHKAAAGFRLGISELGKWLSKVVFGRG